MQSISIESIYVKNFDLSLENVLKSVEYSAQ
jgi:hypothetical protein